MVPRFEAPLLGFSPSRNETPIQEHRYDALLLIDRGEAALICYVRLKYWPYHGSTRVAHRVDSASFQFWINR
jgi:hypothetical protein